MRSAVVEQCGGLRSSQLPGKLVEALPWAWTGPDVVIDGLRAAVTIAAVLQEFDAFVKYFEIASELHVWPLPRP